MENKRQPLTIQERQAKLDELRDKNGILNLSYLNLKNANLKNAYIGNEWEIGGFGFLFKKRGK